MRKPILSFIACLLCTYVLHAQVQYTTTSLQCPLSGTVRLQNCNDTFLAQVRNLEIHEPDESAEYEALMRIKVAQQKKYPYKTTAHKVLKTTAPLAAPTVSMSFVADSNSGTPPDNYLCVSKNNTCVSVMNSFISVLDGNTGIMTKRTGLKTMSLPVGLNNIMNDYRYDPKIIYDPIEDKFICIMLNGVNAANYIVIGFSQTNDPKGNWNFYKFYGDYKGDTTWFDYPAITISKSEFYFTGNKLGFNTSWQAGFKNSVIYQIKKAEGYAGQPLNYKIWDSIYYQGKPIRNLHPVKNGSAIVAETPYFLSNRNFATQNDTVFLIRLTDTLNSANANIQINPLKSNLAYGVAADGRQKDTAYTLATNDARILGAFKEGNEIQFVNTSINPSNGAASIYHGTIQQVSSNPSLQAQLLSIDSLDMAYPNISYFGVNNGTIVSVINCNYSGPRTFAGMHAIISKAGQYSDWTNIKKGDSNIVVLSAKQQRWGDYTGSQMDWNFPGNAWVIGIFGNAKRGYGNYMARLSSPYNVGIPSLTENKIKSISYPNPCYQFTAIDFTLKTAAVLNFDLYNATGQYIGHLLTQFCEEGENRLQFNIGYLSTGVYRLIATDVHGAPLIQESIIKQ
ncbi:MAG: hypothetical protein KGN97_02465 [Bacteroidota bacterium]|nr:hypothetical protein [Bacteroidota bacterium]